MTLYETTVTAIYNVARSVASWNGVNSQRNIMICTNNITFCGLVLDYLFHIVRTFDEVDAWYVGDNETNKY